MGLNEARFQWNFDIKYSVHGVWVWGTIFFEEAGEIGSEKKGNIHLLCTENTCTCTCMYQVLRNVSFFVTFCIRSKWMIPKGNSIQLRWGYLRYWQWHEGHYCWREKWVNAKYFLFLKYFKFQICLEYFVDKKRQFFGVPKKEIEDNKH